MRRFMLLPGSFLLCIFLFCAASVQAQTNVGAVNVGSSATAEYSVEFLNPGTLGAITGTTGGKQNLDFSASEGSCKLGTYYAANALCTVKVKFTPTLAGPRYGSVVLTTHTGIPLGELFVSGIGQAPQTSFSPAPQTQILGNNTTSYFTPDGLTTDSGGNAYAVIGTYQESLGGGAPTYGTVLRLPGSVKADALAAGLPSDVSVDGGGNTYVLDTITGISVLLPNGSYGFSTIPARNFGVTDADSNLYKSCSTGLCKESLTFGGAYTESTISSISPVLLIVDGSGNLFATTSSGGGTTIYKLQPSGDNYIQTTVADNLSSVNALAADPFGNVYYADSSTNVYKEALQPDGGYAQTLLFTGAVTQYTVNWAGHDQHSDTANRLAVDPAGNVYFWKQTGTFKDTSSNPNLPSTQVPVYGLFEAAYSQPSVLTFPQTTQYTLSAPQTITITNSGNLPLDVAAVTFPEAFQAAPSGGGSCLSLPTLPPSDSCTINVIFRPIGYTGSGDSATVTESLKITTNTGNVAGTKQSISLTGVELPAVAPTPVINVHQSGPQFATVTISTTNPAAAIYYTLDESQPTTSSLRYHGPFQIQVSSGTTSGVSNGIAIKAISTLPGYRNSPLAFNFAGNLPPAPANPDFSLAQGVTYNVGQPLTITDSTPGAQISYTLIPRDGSAVSSGSGASPLTLNLQGSADIRAYACAQYYSCTNFVFATYTVISPTPTTAFRSSGSTHPGKITTTP
ncbi:MAG TPA: FN3 associated domain-containing protein [Acidobacteriaceae bacterium]|nr:FN3 associated domain-containing protein [Acidobacteriaceae bacterium]